jgi:hypothetical protein
LEEELTNIEIPDIPLSDIFNRKKEETFYKIKLLKAFKDKNAKDITVYSTKVF